MLTGIVSELVVDSSNTDSSLDSLNEYIQSVNNRIDTQIESLEQSLLANISAGDTAVKTELLNVINNKFAVFYFRTCTIRYSYFFLVMSNSKIA